MEAIGITMLVIFSVAISLYLGSALPIVLPQISTLFDRKPFNCRPCSTFHLIWVSVGSIAWMFGKMWLLVFGIAIAFLVFFVVKYIDNKKIEE